MRVAYTLVRPDRPLGTLWGWPSLPTPPAPPPCPPAPRPAPTPAGLVCLELYKVVQAKPIEAYRNTFANLALPLFAMAEPIASKTVKYKVRRGGRRGGD